MNARSQPTYESVIQEICQLDWAGLTRDELSHTAWAYYYFSIQFRENLEIARKLHPDDDKLRQLEREECKHQQFVSLARGRRGRRKDES
jgi:hypothetical protein